MLTEHALPEGDAMAGRRELYSRPDVPRGGEHRNARAAVALVVIACVLAGVVWFLWQRANADSTLGDSELSASLADARTTPEPAKGTKASGDTFKSVLLFLVDDASTDKPVLKKVQVLCLDVSQNKGSLVTLPSDMRMSASGSESPLADAFSSNGAAACVAGVADASGLPLDHVIVLDQGGMDKLMSLSSAGASELVNHATELLGMMRTDMAPQDLLDLAEKCRAVGTANLSKVEAESSKSDDGGVTVDKTALGLAVGLLVSE